MNLSAEQAKPKYYFWHTLEQRWYEIIPAGDLGVKAWYELLRRTGWCTAKTKGA